MNSCTILAYTFDGALLCATHGAELERQLQAECDEHDDGSSVSDVLGVVFADSEGLDGLEWCGSGHTFCGSCGTEYPADETPSRLETCWNCRSCLTCGNWSECTCEPDGLDIMVRAYAECAVWASSDFPADATEEERDGNPTPLDDLGYSADDIPEEVLAEMRGEILDFWRGEKVDLEGLEPAQVGHDFWLSRNGHGAGFFDRGYGARGDRLQNAAKVYGESNLLIGEDGALFLA